MDGLAFSSIEVVARLLHRRELSAVEVTQTLLARIDRYGERLNPFITVLADRALNRAWELDRQLARGRSRGPLHGIPVALKDNLATAGVRTTAGSRILGDWIPDADAAVVRRLTRAGAIVLGKTSMWEFGYGDVHPDYEEVRNPWDLKRTCATSSTGSACAVAAGLAFGALGTDTGGSVRLPAAVCGVVGLKPSLGLVSRRGVVPVSHTLDAVGPLGRRVSDVALQLEAIGGPDEDDSSAVAQTVERFADRLDGVLDDIVVGLPAPQAGDGLTPDVRRGVERAVAALVGAGARVREVAVPSHDEVASVLWKISGVEAVEHHQQWLATRATEYSPGVRRQLRAGEMLKARDYATALRARATITASYADAMAGVDVLAMPVLPLTAWRLGSTTVEVDGRIAPLMESIARWCAAANVTGRPSISVPCGLGADGLPLAIQFVGRLDADASLLRVADAFERLADWRPGRVPTAIAPSTGHL